MILRQYLHNEPVIAASYIFGCGSKRAGCVVDPVEPPEFYVREAADLGLDIRYVIDTHVHADHISTGRAVAEVAQASYSLHESVSAGFGFDALHDGQRIELGNTVIEIMHVPGHTPEHIALLVSDRVRANEPWLVVTGHTLMIGDLGRTELASSAEEGAAALFESAQRLKALADYVEILPGAFAGSVCGRGLSGKPTSTIGFERRFSKAFGVADREAFIRLMVSDIPPAPPRAADARAKPRKATRSQSFVNTTPPSIQLGLRANWRQFTILVLINAFVGAMVGLERSALPLAAASDFGIASASAMLSFIATFGLTKAATNLLAGWLVERRGRRATLIAGWLVGVPVPFLILWAPRWEWIVAANAVLGVSQGLAWSTTVIMKIDLADRSTAAWPWD